MAASLALAVPGLVAAGKKSKAKSKESEAAAAAGVSHGTDPVSATTSMVEIMMLGLGAGSLPNWIVSRF